MIRFLISTGITLLANAIGLIVAAAVLDDMSIDGAAFVLAILIFTGVEMIAEPFLQKLAVNQVRVLQGGVALVATYVGLLVTDVVSDGLDIEGTTTWLAATLIVWLAALLAALILPIFLVKRAAEERR